MKKLYFLLLAFALTCFIASCNKDGSGSVNAHQGLIVGTWNLQQEDWAQYVDGVEQIDTSYLATVNSTSYVKFNATGTFSSVSHSVSFITGGNNLGNGSTNVASVDSVSGTYSYTGSAFSISSPVAGFSNVTGSFGAATEVAVFKIVSQSAQISQLTASKLNMHVEYIYTATTSTGSKTYKNEMDLYYTK